ncbi:hypothetical protein Tco_0042501 [Tanacetum coccineum]
MAAGTAGLTAAAMGLGWVVGFGLQQKRVFGWLPNGTRHKGAFGLGRSTQGVRLVNSGGVWSNKETNKDAFGLAAAPHGVRLA